MTLQPHRQILQNVEVAIVVIAMVYSAKKIACMSMEATSGIDQYTRFTVSLFYFELPLLTMSGRNCAVAVLVVLGEEETLE